MLEEMIKQRDELAAQIEAIRKQERAARLAEIRAIMVKHGISIEDLGGRSGGKRGPVAVKYRSGDKTWTGRGRQPVWVRDALAAGQTLESLAV